MIRVENAEVSIKNGQVAHVILNQFTLIRNDIENVVGQPINHQEMKQMKNNPKGDNLLPARKQLGKKNNSNVLDSLFE